MSTRLPSEAFVALAAVAWADGRMTRPEAQGLVLAARALGLEGDDVAKVERATKEKVTIDGFDPSHLSPQDGLLTYGLATWLARLDGVQNAAEQASLKALEGKLRSADLTDHRLQAAAAVAFDVAMLPEGRRPDRFDFVAVATRLRERFPKLT
jgi:hypothetical protein